MALLIGMTHRKRRRPTALWHQRHLLMMWTEDGRRKKTNKRLEALWRSRTSKQDRCEDIIGTTFNLQHDSSCSTCPCHFDPGPRPLPRNATASFSSPQIHIAHLVALHLGLDLLVEGLELVHT